MFYYFAAILQGSQRGLRVILIITLEWGTESYFALEWEDIWEIEESCGLNDRFKAKKTLTRLETCPIVPDYYYIVRKFRL